MRFPIAIWIFIFFGLWLGPLGLIWAAGTTALAIAASVGTGLHVQNQSHRELSNSSWKKLGR